jgi:uncharacterized membrane protein
VEVVDLKGLFAMGLSFAAQLLPVAWILLATRRTVLQTRRATLLLAVAILGIVFALSLAEYLIWTPVGARAVEGLQNRYYLPLVPFALLLTLPGAVRGRWRERLWQYRYAAVAIFLATDFILPFVLAHRYYGTGLLAFLFS